MMKKADGVIEVYLGDHSGAGNGPIIEFSKVEIARKMLQRGMPVDEVAEVVDMTIQEIKEMM